MLKDRWLTDRTPTERFPDYTRANAGEVLRDPVTPLGWTFGWEEGVVLGCRDAFVSFGVFDADEYGDPPETFGMFGGYFYNSLTQPRLMGVRMPGATPEAIDKAYFDDRPDVPPYVAKDWHESPKHEAKLAETMAYVMSGVPHEPVDQQKARAAALRASRPDLSALTNEQLVARARSVQPDVVSNFEQHAWVTVGASLPSGAIAAIAEAIGRSEDVAALLSGLGDVDSAAIAQQLWALSRLIRNSPEFTAAFDAGIEGLGARIEGTELADGLEAFMYEHGGRGPNEWDIAASSYETTPELAYVQLDVMRRREDDADPIAALERSTAERARLRAEFEEALADDAEALGTFQAAMDSASVWMSARERTKSYNIRTLHEARMCFNELGRRMAAAGQISEAAHIYMVLSDELDDFLADPGRFSGLLVERASDFALLAGLEPPFIVDGQCPPLSEWPAKATADVERASVGDELFGVACASGTATGRARVILDPTDPSALEPGDILVTVSTDPSWTPLFLAAGAVVTNVGAVASHASIVSRELGIPCVASIQDATLRIPDGATLTVDGSTGRVTVDAVP